MKKKKKIAGERRIFTGEHDEKFWVEFFLSVLVAPGAFARFIIVEMLILQRRLDFDTFSHSELFFSVGFISNVIAMRMILDQFDGSRERQRTNPIPLP